MAHLDFEKPLVELERRIEELRAAAAPGDDVSAEVGALQEHARRLQRELYSSLSEWQKVQLSRHPERPYFLDYLGAIFDDFLELHGDRAFADDPAIVSGFARLDGRAVAVIGHQKGRTTKEKVRRNFGMAHPEGYRKAVRIMELAGRYGRPVFTFIDTPGAYPGIGAEERGQGEAIGQALLTMSRLPVPVIATVIGEGGSGGALGLGVANRVLMFEYATYSVITPEGCASILWRDGAEAPRAAEQLKLLASHAIKHGIVDELILEPSGGAHRDPATAATALGKTLRRHLADLSGMSGPELVAQRYARFRSIGAITGG
ncbi:MAG: acetyl-CoA carboxylase carboxyltransferase subunit alpha [Myxococcales bacterium]|nr:acetyl-CoA carboxylase carboxyltransferase subunit alpha [Myxococcales bacterium]MCB9627259.1 acetyl-CoA carboxylase carboxyltransferase subunit alpha [Sandaracinaceae bacterium]